MAKFKVKENIKNSKSLNQFKKNFKKSTLGSKILTIIMSMMVLGFTCTILFFIYIIIAAPEFDVEKLYTTESSTIVDSEGNEIARLGTENRQKLTYDELPEVFVDALVATEDSRFFQHVGIDMARFLKATFGQLLGNSDAGGASTLTMQLAKLRYTDTTSSGIKGIIRKFTDIYMAVFKLEKNYTKEQIIEFYVNIPYLGSGTYGIEQAAQTYFGKSASELSLPEAATIAGLFQSPSAYDPLSYPELAEERRNIVLNLMKRHGYITETECELAKSIPMKSLIVDTGNSTLGQYAGFIDTVVEEVIAKTGKNPYETPMKVYSTMIAKSQDALNDVYSGKDYTWPNDTIQAGVAVLDNKTGAIIAIGAGRNRNVERAYNFATMIEKQPGSTAKPIFDYGPAIEYLNWSTGQTVVDDEWSYSGGLSINNWDNKFLGTMTIKDALASSRNIPALYTYQQLTQKQIKTFATSLGITPEYEADGFINESHSLGGFTGVNPLQMAAAYATFARGGIYIEPYSFTKIEFIDTGEEYIVTPEKRTVMSEATAYMINMILKHAVTGGYVSASSKSGTDIASKTGTSTVDANFRKSLGLPSSVINDSWQMVYSPDYTCGIWVGYKEITKTSYLTSTQGANVKKAIIKNVVSQIFKSNSRWEMPSTVVTAEIEKETFPLQLASDYTPESLRSVEYFKKGTVPEEVSQRFSQLDNPSNLKINNNGQITLTWDKVDTPAAIDEGALTEYFQTYYSKWFDKYYNQRITYNNNNIGVLGYQIYITTNGNTSELAFTTSNTYTYQGNISSDVEFTVKTTYSLFKANMSSGISATISPNGEITQQATNNWHLELNGKSTMTVKEYYKFINDGNSPVIVTDNGTTAKKYTITNYCIDHQGNDINCETLDCNNTYEITHEIDYNEKKRSITRQLQKGC